MKKFYQFAAVLGTMIFLISCTKENVQPTAYKNQVAAGSQTVEPSSQLAASSGCQH